MGVPRPKWPSGRAEESKIANRKPKMRTAAAPTVKRWSPAHALKLFLPSWNFFDDFDVVPCLEARVVREPDDGADWRPVFPGSTTRRWTRTFYNPWGNLELMERSLVERAADELGERPDPAELGIEFSRSETFAMLTRLVRRRLRAGAPHLGDAVREPADSARFQFRIVQTGPGVPREVLFVSSGLALDGAMSLAEPAVLA